MSQIQVIISKLIKHIKIGMFVPVFFIIIGAANAQTHEFGAGIGAFNYSGQLSPNYNPVFYRPAFSLFYRHNTTPVIALRSGIYLGQLYAADNSKNPVPALRDGVYKAYLSEISEIVEYNFLNYRALNDPVKFSPYLAGGLGFFVNSAFYGGGRQFEVCMPMGVGIKYKLGKQINLGAEIIARKTFTNNLDGYGTKVINNHETADIFNKDWYYYTSINISYTLYDVKCPQPIKFKF